MLVVETSNVMQPTSLAIIPGTHFMHSLRYRHRSVNQEFLVRIVLARGTLGLCDHTFRSAFSFMEFGTKWNRIFGGKSVVRHSKSDGIRSICHEITEISDVNELWGSARWMEVGDYRALIIALRVSSGGSVSRYLFKEEDTCLGIYILVEGGETYRRNVCCSYW